MKKINVFGREMTVLQIVKTILVGVTVPVIGPVYLVSWMIYKKVRPVIETTNDGYEKMKEAFINDEE